MKIHQEEKLSLALFHHYLLEDFWKENLSEQSYALLNEIIPKTWIIDPRPIGPNAILNAPGKMNRWQDLANLSQKQRRYIIKISGFHETCWGAKSITLGSDSSNKEWLSSVENAIDQTDNCYYIIQEYKKPGKKNHSVFNDKGEPLQTTGRIRLCPYYGVKGAQIDTLGILATFCPIDKKIIHGMKDALMLPCWLS